MFFGRGFFLECPREHELGLENRTGWFYDPVQRGRHPFVVGMAYPLLNVLDRLTGLALIPGSVQLLGDRAELNDQVVGQVPAFAGRHICASSRIPLDHPARPAGWRHDADGASEPTIESARRSNLWKSSAEKLRSSAWN